MNSVAQVAVGILILGTAFVFGSQMHNSKGDSQTTQQSADSNAPDFVWQKPAFEPQGKPIAKIGESSKGGLIDMPVAKKRLTGLPNSNMPVIPAIPGSSSIRNSLPRQYDNSAAQILPQPEMTSVLRKEIVEPDFSQLASSFANQTEVRVPQANLAPLPKIQPQERDINLKPSALTPNPNNIARTLPTFDRERWAEREPAQPILSQPNSSMTQARRVADIPIRTDQLTVVQRVPIASYEMPKAEPSSGREPSRTLFQPLAPPTTETDNRYFVSERARSQLAEVGSRSTNSLRLETNQFVKHEARPGESLQVISRKYYGKPDFYLDIYLANQNVLSNPAHIPPGTTLRIPVYE